MTLGDLTVWGVIGLSFFAGVFCTLIALFLMVFAMKGVR